MTTTRASARGFSLIEIVLVIGAVAVLLGLCAGILHVLLRLDRTGRQHLVETATVGRLARQFRHDVRAATAAKPIAGETGLARRLELSLTQGHVVEYQGDEHSVVRLEKKKHGGSIDRREFYRLPFCWDPRFSLHDERGQATVCLELPRGGEPGTNTVPSSPPDRRQRGSGPSPVSTRRQGDVAMRRSHPGRDDAPPLGRRRAAITVAVLVCLLIMTLLGAGLLRMVGTQRKLIRNEERALQADWLAESGIDRAAARLAEDPHYSGETWSITAETLGGPSPGVVTIKVEPRRDGPERRLVTVQADYPSALNQRVRSSKTAIVDLSLPFAPKSRETSR